jgi:hypothetical protein
MLILFESAAGYGLFSLSEGSSKLKNVDSVQQIFQNVDQTKKMYVNLDLRSRVFSYKLL